MENSIYSKLGMDPVFIDILLIILVIVLAVLFVNVNMKYTRLKSSYASFMRGKDGKNLEKSIIEKFDEVDAVTAIAKQNKAEIRKIYRRIEKNYQKQGILKYDAFHEMGGNLSFALCLLDAYNNGWIINAMHSREGCYTYIKEILNGESYIELSEEEAQALDKAIYEEVYEHLETGDGK